MEEHSTLTPRFFIIAPTTRFSGTFHVKTKFTVNTKISKSKSKTTSKRGQRTIPNISSLSPSFEISTDQPETIPNIDLSPHDDEPTTSQTEHSIPDTITTSGSRQSRIDALRKRCHIKHQRPEDAANTGRRYSVIVYTLKCQHLLRKLKVSSDIGNSVPVTNLKYIVYKQNFTGSDNAYTV